MALGQASRFISEDIGSFCATYRLRSSVKQTWHVIAFAHSNLLRQIWKQWRRTSNLSSRTSWKSVNNKTEVARVILDPTAARYRSLSDNSKRELCDEAQLQGGGQANKTAIQHLTSMPPTQKSNQVLHSSAGHERAMRLDWGSDEVRVVTNSHKILRPWRTEDLSNQLNKLSSLAQQWHLTQACGLNHIIHLRDWPNGWLLFTWSLQLCLVSAWSSCLMSIFNVANCYRFSARMQWC